MLIMGASPVDSSLEVKQSIISQEELRTRIFLSYFHEGCEKGKKEAMDTDVSLQAETMQEEGRWAWEDDDGEPIYPQYESARHLRNSIVHGDYQINRDGSLTITDARKRNGQGIVELAGGELGNPVRISYEQLYFFVHWDGGSYAMLNVPAVIEMRDPSGLHGQGPRHKMRNENLETKVSDVKIGLRPDYSGG